MSETLNKLKETLVIQLNNSILNQGGVETDLLYIEKMINDICAKIALEGINERSTRKVYRLKPINKIGEVSSLFNRRLNLSWNREDLLEKGFPLPEICNDAYCEILEIEVGDYDFMLKQITDVEKVPAEANFLLSLASEDLLLEEVKKHITSIHPSNFFESSREHSFEITNGLDVSQMGNIISFLKKDELTKFFRTINILVRHEKFIEL